MAAAAGAGLNTHIWNNNLRSVFLLALYPLIIMAIVWGASYVIGLAQFGPGETPLYEITFHENGRDWGQSGTASATGFATNIVIAFWPAILTIVAVWFLIAFFFHTRMVRRLAHSHPVTREEEPELYNLLENLCISRGMTMPRLEIIESHARNAFASGIDKKSFCVTVTRGLLNSLQKDEVEAVLAHELTHIENRDVRLLIICIIFTGMIGFFAQLVWSNIRLGLWLPRSNNRNAGSAILVVLAIAAVLWVGYMATLFTRFTLSRRREYMADAGAVEMTKNPEGMMRALLRIAGRERIPETTDDIAMMCIENSKPFFGVFATHPPLEKRIAAISEVTNTPVPQIKGAPVGRERSFQAPERPHNPWLIRERKTRKKIP